MALRKCPILRCLAKRGLEGRTTFFPLVGTLPILRGSGAGSCASAGAEAQAQRVELDEPLGVALVVDGVFLEGDVGEAV